MDPISQAMELLGQPGWVGALFEDQQRPERSALLKAQGSEALCQVWEGEVLLLEAAIPRSSDESRLRLEIKPLAGQWSDEAAKWGLSEAGARARCASVLLQTLMGMSAIRVDLGEPSGEASLGVGLGAGARLPQAEGRSEAPLRER